jgi:hypothetical protein
MYLQSCRICSWHILVRVKYLLVSLARLFSGSCEFVSKIDSAVAPTSTKIAQAKILTIGLSKSTACSWKRKIALKMLTGQVSRQEEENTVWAYCRHAVE